MKINRFSHFLLGEFSTEQTVWTHAVVVPVAGPLSSRFAARKERHSSWVDGQQGFDVRLSGLPSDLQ